MVSQKKSRPVSAKLPSKTSQTDTLRQKAEKIVGKEARAVPKMPPEKMDKLIHELQVHQIELEMQNDELRRTQQELEFSRSKYADLYDFAPLGYFTFDRIGRILEANLTGARLLGADRSLLINKPMNLFVMPDYQERFRSHRLKALRGNDPEICDLRLRKMDGTPFFAQLKSIPTKKTPGNPAEIRTAVMDITERRRAEEAFRAEHAFREALENSVLSGLLAFDLEGKQIYTNPAFCRMVGWKKDDLVGAKPPFLYWPPEEIELLTKTFLGIFSGENPVGKVELRLKKRSGTRFEALFLFSPLKDSGGKAVGWVASVGDITEMKQREEEIRRLNADLEERVRRRTAELESINQSLNTEIEERERLQQRSARLVSFPRLNPLPILEVNHSGVITFINQAAREVLTQASIEDVKAFFPEDLEDILKSLAQRKPGTYKREIEIKGRFFEETLQLVLEFNVVRIYSTEITERKKREELRKASNEINFLINSTLDSEVIMERALKHSAEAMASETAAISLRQGDRWIVSFTYGFPEEWVGTQMEDSEEPHAVLAIKTKKTVVVNDAYNDERVNREHMKKYGIRSVLIVPLVVGGEALGVIFFNNHSSPVAFTKAQIDFAGRLGASVSLALKNARLFKQVKEREEEINRSRDQLEIRVQERTQNLNKRLQEITCLSAISRRLFESQEPVEKVLREIVDLIPTGWQYPQVTCARITYEGQEFECKDFKETPWKQSRHLLSRGEKVGLLEVYYLEQKPAEDEGPFLKEETILLDAIAQQMGQFIGRRLAEEERLRLAAAVEQAYESVLITEPQGIIRYLNPAFESIHGCDRQEILGKKYEEVLRNGPEDEGIENNIRDSVRRGEKWAGHVTKRKDGKVIELEMTISPLRDQTGKIINYLFVERDVTEEAKLQLQIHQVQKLEALGTLAGGIAHDFNNLLMSMVINTDLALMDAPMGTPMRSCLEQILKAANIGQSLVKQIVAFSRPAQQQRYPMTVSSIVQEALKLIRASIPTTIEIRQNLEAQTSMAMVNPGQVHQVLVNLCSNAAYAMRGRDGLLEVSLVDVEVDAALAALHPDLDPGTYIQLTVKDTGQGIDPTILERIFEPFFTTKGRGEGSGMGLAVVHGIVKGLGGAITVSSVPGQGSTFNIFFPRVQADAVLETFSSILQPGKNERVLLVDDDQPILRSLQSALERLDYRVTAASDSQEAWEIFRSQPDAFDLVITDQIMPRMTGMQLAEKLLGLRKDIPIILITGFSEGLSEDAVKGLGVREFLLKPTNTQTLSEAMRRVLDQNRK